MLYLEKEKKRFMTLFQTSLSLQDFNYVTFKLYARHTPESMGEVIHSHGKAEKRVKVTPKLWPFTHANFPKSYLVRRDQFKSFSQIGGMSL